MLMSNARRSPAPWIQRVCPGNWQFIILLFTFTISGCAGITASKSTRPVGGALTVSITSPASGATVSGTTTATATATDPVGITSVQFQVDGTSLGASLTAAPYSLSLDTRALSNGKHNLTAIAVDNSGNKATSTVVSILISNLSAVPPTVSITSPVSGATVSGTTTVTATATDPVGITSVQFQVHGTSLGASLTAAPYSLSLDTRALSNGKHNLTAIAVDNSGNKATSTVVSILISNLSAVPPTVSITS